MTSYSVIKVLNMILEFIYSLSDFTYKALFYEVNLFGTTFPLWQIFSVLGVSAIIIAIIIKIFF